MSAVLLLINPFLKLIAFFVFSLSESQKVLQSLPLYTLCLFSMLLNDNIVKIKKSDGMCSPNFTVDKFKGLLLHPSILIKL